MAGQVNPGQQRDALKMLEFMLNQVRVGNHLSQALLICGLR